MEYCPEIAVLHGAFALADAESKRQCTKDLLQHQKGHTTARSFLLVKDSLREIVSGLETQRSTSAKQRWSRRLLQILFHKAFTEVQSEELDEASLEKLTKENKFKSVLSRADFPTSLKCAQACLEFVSTDHSSLDLHLISVTVNFLVSCCVAEILHGCRTDGPSESAASAAHNTSSFLSSHPKPAAVWEHKRFDEEGVTELVNTLIQLLEMVQQRSSLTQHSEDSIKNGGASEEEEMGVKRSLEHLFTCTSLLAVMSFSSSPVSKLAATLSKYFVEEDEEEDEGDTLQADSYQHRLSNQVVNGESSASATSQQTDLQQNLLQSLRRPDCQTACKVCISNIFTSRSSQSHHEEETTAQKTESQSSLGDSMGLELQLLVSACPVKTVLVLREFCQLLCSSEAGEGAFTGGMQGKMSSLLGEVEMREEEEERKRQNPGCLDFGLAKRDLHGWWYSGFLDLLRGKPQVLHRESDVKNLLSVLADAVKNVSQPEADKRIAHLAELTMSLFARLPLLMQEKVILDHYMNVEVPWLPLVENFDQALTVTFNKLSASSTAKDLNAVLQLAFHDPVTFMDHAVRVAVANAGQVSLVVKVLRLMPAVCRCTHPQNHPDSSLLSHSIHAALHGHPLDSREQKNIITLVSSLVQTHGQENGTALLLSPAEFLTASVLPNITLPTPSTISPPVSIDFALRLLIGVLGATLKAGLTDWLNEVHPAALAVCCAELVDECVELVTDTGDVDLRARIRSLVLTVLELLQRHLHAAKISLEDSSLRWVQDRCATLDWTVLAYLADILKPVSEGEANQLLSCLAVECVRQASSDPLSLLRLAAVSDAAEREVLQLVHSSAEAVTDEAAILKSLCELLPHLLVSEVKRVVRALSALISAGHLDVSFRCVFADSITITAFKEAHSEVCVSQLLMDAAVLMSQNQQLCVSQSSCHNLAQVLVAGLQEILQRINRQPHSTSSVFLIQQIFCHVCIIMSSAPEVMLDSLFVVLLDLLTKLPQDSVSAPEKNMQLMFDVLGPGIELIPKESMQQTLMKRLEKRGVSG
ncbi:hypothetical protein BaRGS_00004257 [Batillaria attramentaria]|uniref:Uncharacterized protein n=1 Tax=Batillaria attramentaria TaxID=370345 RepID=A0ABD0LZ10_9CAEN